MNLAEQGSQKIPKFEESTKLPIRQSFPHQMTAGTYFVQDKQGKLYLLRTSVLLQFQILFDGVEKNMDNSRDFP